MDDAPFYHEGMREIQDLFDSRRLADHFAAQIVKDALTPDQAAFITSLNCFFLATADAAGRPDCSYKGGAPGFVQVLDERTVAFPDYDGNGMFRSMGNMKRNPAVGLLFIDFQSPRRVRLNGTAGVHADDPLLAGFPGAQLIVRVAVREVFPNCPRYIHPAGAQALSPHAPRAGYEPPDAEWKEKPERRTVLPRKGPGRNYPEEG